MYTKYGKACRSKKSSKSSTEESEKSGQINDPEVKEDEAKSDSNENDDNVEDTGADNEGNADDEEEEEQEKEGNSPRQRRASVHFHAKDRKPTDENDDNEMSKDDDENENVEDESESATGDVVENVDDESSEDAGAGGPDENDQSDESEAFDEEASTDDDDVASKKKFKKVKPVMEYDIKNMYPDIEILVQKKKREWDFQDPDIIRALWLEAKTQVLTEWKIRNAKIKIDKPSFEVRETYTVKLRHKHFQEEADRKADSEIREIKMTVPGRVPPQLGKLEINTNLTFDMRYKYNRNNPPVPSHYIEHFEKFKRPPFDNNATRYVF